MIHVFPAVAMAAVHATLVVVAAAAHVVAAVDLKTPMVRDVGKPVFAALDVAVGLGAAFFLVKQLHNHRGEGVGLILIESGVLAAGGVALLGVIAGIAGVA